MACNISIIMSDFPYWEEQFSKCAIFVNPKDPNDIAKKIDWLIDNREKSEQLIKKGNEIVKKKYSWETEAIKLVEMYKGLI